MATTRETPRATRKGREVLSWGSERESGPAHTWTQTSVSQNCEKIYICYLRSPSLRQSVTATLGNNRRTYPTSAIQPNSGNIFIGCTQISPGTCERPSYRSLLINSAFLDTPLVQRWFWAKEIYFSQVGEP